MGMKEGDKVVFIYRPVGGQSTLKEGKVTKTYPSESIRLQFNMPTYIDNRLVKAGRYYKIPEEVI